jgi:hypothetical protein
MLVRHSLHDGVLSRFRENDMAIRVGFVFLRVTLFQFEQHQLPTVSNGLLDTP